MRAQSMPMGISEPVSVRESKSIITINAAPREMLTGISFWLLLPVSILPIWGITSPTQPMVPLMHTAAAVQRVAPPIMRICAFLTSSPRLSALFEDTEK